MGLKYKIHSKIDKKAWDDTLAEAAHAQLYANAWYLDIVNPQWEAFVIENNIKGYDAIFPLPIKKKLGLKYVVQPLFTSQLGLFGNYTSSDLQDVIMFLQKKFRRYNLNVNVNNIINDVTIAKNQLINCELPLIKDYDSLYKAFNIKKENAIGVKPTEYNKLEVILNRCNQLNITIDIIAATHNNVLIAAGVFVQYNHAVVYINGASTQMGKKQRAMFAVMNHIIRKYASTGLILDFKGGQMPGTKRFFTGFGAQEKTYYNIYRAI